MKWMVLLASLCFIPLGNCYIYSAYEYLKSKLGYENCDQNFINPDFYKLRKSLKENLFGQDIIIDKIVPALESHFKHEPKKALVICMHGWTGIGKNYATKMIIDSIYKNKMDSSFVHLFSGRLHFPLDIKEYVDQYKISIQEWIKGNVTRCSRSVFVFDEIDKMPAGIVDAIKPFFDYHEKLDSIDYRKTIFVFISNIGAETINSQFRQLWLEGKTRESMKYKDFEPLLRNALYNTRGAFKNSAILEDHLVSLYLPFLPLEEEHVKMCVRKEIERQNVGVVSEGDIDSVLDEMEFNVDRFSTSGCKRVADIVATLRYKMSDEL